MNAQHHVRLKGAKRIKYAGIFHRGIVPVIHATPYPNVARRPVYRVAVSQLAGWQRERLAQMLANKNAGIPPDLDRLDLTIEAKNADPLPRSAFLF